MFSNIPELELDGCCDNTIDKSVHSVPIEFNSSVDTIYTPIISSLNTMSTECTRSTSSCSTSSNTNIFTFTFADNFGSTSTSYNSIVAKKESDHKRTFTVKITTPTGVITTKHVTCSGDDTLDHMISNCLRTYNVHFNTSVVFIHKTNAHKTRIIATRLAGRFSSLERVRKDEFIHIDRSNERNMFIRSEIASTSTVFVQTLDGQRAYLHLDLRSEDDFIIHVHKRIRRQYKSDKHFKCYRHSYSCIHGSKHEELSVDEFSTMECMTRLNDYDYYWKGCGLSSGVIVAVETEKPFKQNEAVVSEKKKKMSL
jgi:hypothetical protein